MKKSNIKILSFILFMISFIFIYQIFINKKDVKSILINDIYKDNNEIIEEYKKDIRNSLIYGKVIELKGEDVRTSKQKIAQDIAISDSDFGKDNVVNGKNVHVEIMRVDKVKASENKIKEIKNNCNNNNCYKVYKYNFFSNSTKVAYVDVDDKKVLRIDSFENMQGEINSRLKTIAKIIAINNSQIKEMLGYSPNSTEATMANVRTELKETKCERSKHLCVAPTFLDYSKKESLWAIIDLTELKLVGAKFTDLGGGSDFVLVTERSLQNNYVNENFCDKDNSFEEGFWSGKYRLTDSDGLEIIDVKYKDKRIIDSIKLVDWHVSYDEKDKDISTDYHDSEVEDGKFGYSDATGCPSYGTSVVVSFDGPKIKKIKNSDGEGFSLVQDFRNPGWPLSCNYRYKNIFEFYDDGSFRVAGENLGRGCGVSGWYRPVFRIDLHTDDGDEMAIKSVDGKKIEKEVWFSPEETMKLDSDNIAFKIKSSSGNGFSIYPDIGNFSNKGRGDNAFSYFTKKKESEGVGDLITIGSCCNTDYKQGPEKFINEKEELKGEIIFWYVPQMKNSNKKNEEYCWSETIVKNGKPEVISYPCSSGPIIKPFWN